MWGERSGAVVVRRAPEGGHCRLQVNWKPLEKPQVKVAAEGEGEQTS